MLKKGKLANPIKATAYWEGNKAGYYFDRSVQGVLDGTKSNRKGKVSSDCASCSCGIGGCGDGGGCDG